MVMATEDVCMYACMHAPDCSQYWVEHFTTHPQLHEIGDSDIEKWSILIVSLPKQQLLWLLPARLTHFTVTTVDCFIVSLQSWGELSAPHDSEVGSAVQQFQCELYPYLTSTACLLWCCLYVHLKLSRIQLNTTVLIFNNLKIPLAAHMLYSVGCPLLQQSKMANNIYYW